MTEEICEHNKCTGCAACVNVCPKKCISMQVSDLGFDYPVIDNSKCIDCKICLKTCPVRNEYVDDKKNPKTYAAFNKNDEIRKLSSSGGIFSLLAEHIILNNGVVYGAVWDEHFVLKHSRIDAIVDVPKMRGSKYVQSKTDGIYDSVKKDLLDGKNVLFSGTPCQIGGLYAYLKGEKYDNLFTQDLICHGVCSPKIWEKYIQYREKIADSNVKSVSFRDKRTGWKRFSVTFQYRNSTEYSSPLTKDYFMRGFLNHLYLRKSCTQCAFKDLHRQADITLADFWGVENYLSECNDDKGITAIMIHSRKGERLLSAILPALEIKTTKYNDVLNFNKSALESVHRNPLCERFYRDSEKLEFDKLIEKYAGSSFISKIRRKMAQMFIK